MKAQSLAIAVIAAIAYASPTKQKRDDYSDSSLTERLWSNRAPLPHLWQEHSTVALGSNIYILGGIGLSVINDTVPPTLKDMARYDSRTDTWSLLAPMPSALNHPNAIASHGKIYVLGGLAPRENPLDWQASGAAFYYDPSTSKWASLPTIPADIARGSAAMAIHGDEILLAAGMTDLRLSPPQQLSTAAVHAFNIRSETWRTLPSLPEARDHDGYVVSKDRFYVVGGRVNGQYNVRNTTFSLYLRNTAAGWSVDAQMPTARGGCSAGVLDGVIYVFGGEGDQVEASQVYPQVEAYDIAHDLWTKLPNMPMPRHGTVAMALGGGIYIPGGGDKISAAPTDTMQYFQPSRQA